MYHVLMRNSTAWHRRTPAHGPPTHHFSAWNTWETTCLNRVPAQSWLIIKERMDPGIGPNHCDPTRARGGGGGEGEGRGGRQGRKRARRKRSQTAPLTQIAGSGGGRECPEAAASRRRRGWRGLA
eukprot:9480216-Pyramimonas_sp.AAC.1